jgi:hypothetical protein
MTKTLNTLAASLLFINGTGAIYGGYKLFMAPDGSGLGIPLDILKHSPFHTFLIPGITLFITSGIFSLIVLAMLLVKYRRYASYIVAQGAILTGWITIQVLLIQAVAALHIIFLIIGVSLIVCGALLLKASCKLNNRRYAMDSQLT